MNLCHLPPHLDHCAVSPPAWGDGPVCPRDEPLSSWGRGADPGWPAGAANCTSQWPVSSASSPHGGFCWILTQTISLRLKHYWRECCWAQQDLRSAKHLIEHRPHFTLINITWCLTAHWLTALTQTSSMFLCFHFPLKSSSHINKRDIHHGELDY